MELRLNLQGGSGDGVGEGQLPGAQGLGGQTQLLGEQLGLLCAVLGIT